MRYFVNRKLSDPKSKLWALYKEVVKDYAEVLGEALINVILKTKLYEQLNAKKLKGKNFNFSLITGIADISDKGVVKISDARVDPLKTTLCGLKRIEKVNKNDPYKLIVDAAQSSKSKAAKIFFNLIKGSSKVLDIRVRYKGTFTAKPQFQGGMTSEFKKLVDKECGSP